MTSPPDSSVVALDLVIARRATVTFDADARVVRLGAGSVARLRAGERTVWTVTESLRKAYIAQMTIAHLHIAHLHIAHLHIARMHIARMHIARMHIA